MLFGLQKKLDFTLKVIGGDISTIPGLSDAIEVCLTFDIGLSLLLQFVLHLLFLSAQHNSMSWAFSL